MNLDQITVVDNPNRDDMRWLDDQLYAFNAARTGIDDGRYLPGMTRHERRTP